MGFSFLFSAELDTAELKRYNDYMGQCKCGHTRDVEKNCDGTHKVVKAVREQIASEIEATSISIQRTSTIQQIIKHFANLARGQK